MKYDGSMGRLEKGVEARQQRDGSWRFRGYLHDNGGKVTGPWKGTPADAYGDRIRLLNKQLDGPLRATATETVSSSSRRFLSGIREATILSNRRRPYAPATVRSYEVTFRERINPELGHIAVDKLRRSQVQRFVDGLIAEGHGDGTIRNTWAALAALYTWLIPRHDDLTDPTPGVILPRPAKPRDTYVVPGLLEDYVQALPEKYRLPFALAFFAGLRLGEIQGLLWEHVDLDGGWIAIRRSLDPFEGFVTPKSGKSREVPIFDALRPYLMSGSGPVVPSRKSKWGVQRLGEPYYRRCRKAWVEAALPPVTLHAARHSFCTALVRAGYDVKQLQEYAGHEDPTTSLRIYTHARGREVGVADKMNTFLSQE